VPAKKTTTKTKIKKLSKLARPTRLSGTGSASRPAIALAVPLDSPTMVVPKAQWVPTKEQLAAAPNNATVKDLIRENLRVLFVGINPGAYSGAVGHHFAGPATRFWPALHAAGITSRILTAFDEAELLDAGVGITNLVMRCTNSADELADEELRAGGQRLRAKLRKWRPRAVGFLGLAAYRTAFEQKKAVNGLQPEPLDGVPVWLLPSPSGLNAAYQIPDLAVAYAEMWRTTLIVEPDKK
jgi:TDG/mug DNA glycosylase family protein